MGDKFVKPFENAFHEDSRLLKRFQRVNKDASDENPPGGGGRSRWALEAPWFAKNLLVNLESLSNRINRTG